MRAHNIFLNKYFFVAAFIFESKISFCCCIYVCNYNCSFIMELDDYVEFDGMNSKLAYSILSQDIFYSSSSAHTMIKADGIFFFFSINNSFFHEYIKKFYIFVNKTNLAQQLFLRVAIHQNNRVTGMRQLLPLNRFASIYDNQLYVR